MMAMRKLILLAALAAMPAQADQLATIRPIAVVEDAVVRLSDLFENAGPRGAAVLGPAPAPGARLVVEAPQLFAIARANGIAWRPLGGAERVVPERAFVQLAIESAMLDAMGARFVATLAIAAEGMPTQRLRLAGRVVETAPMLVAARRLATGEVVRARDVRMVRVPASRLRPGAAQDTSQVVGQALRRPASADQPLLVSDLAQPVAVERGQTVTMHYEIPGMVLTAQGRAMDAAPRGGSVPVMNLASRVVVEAHVIAPGRVRVGEPR
jgi:flagella basal body P-ring formation protein FlgA